MSKSVPPCLLFLASLGILFFIFSCNGDPISLSEPQVPEIRVISAPEKAFIDPGDTLVVYIQVLDPQGVSDIEEVVLRGEQPDASGTFAFDMRDDGSDGDIIASDGQYVVKFTGAIWERAGTGVLSASAVDKSGNRAESEPISIDIVVGTRGNRPVVNEIIFPNTVSLDSTYDISLIAQISDADGLENIDSVKYEIFPPSLPVPAFSGHLFYDGQTDDGIAGNFGTVLNSTDFCTERGFFTIRIQAHDKSENKSFAVTRNFSVSSNLDNLPPQVLHIFAPDTISRSTTGPFVLRAVVHDPNCPTDISRVFFNTFLPNGNPSSGNPFFMRDDGAKDENGLGDNVANDGEYALTIAISASNATGTYRFEFQAEDRAGLLSEKFVRQIVVVE